MSLLSVGLCALLCEEGHRFYSAVEAVAPEVAKQFDRLSLSTHFVYLRTHPDSMVEGDTNYSRLAKETERIVAQTKGAELPIDDTLEMKPLADGRNALFNLQRFLSKIIAGKDAVVNSSLPSLARLRPRSLSASYRALQKQADPIFYHRCCQRVGRYCFCPQPDVMFRLMPSLPTTASMPDSISVSSPLSEAEDPPDPLWPHFTSLIPCGPPVQNFTMKEVAFIDEPPLRLEMTPPPSPVRKSWERVLQI